MEESYKFFIQFLLFFFSYLSCFPQNPIVQGLSALSSFFFNTGKEVFFVEIKVFVCFQARKKVFFAFSNLFNGFLSDTLQEYNGDSWNLSKKKTKGFVIFFANKKVAFCARERKFVFLSLLFLFFNLQSAVVFI